MKRTGMMVKTVSAILASVLLLTGCGNAENESGSIENPDVESVEEIAEDSGKMEELTKIKVTVVAQNKSADIAMVQDAINEISIPAINVEVELEDITIVDAMFASYYTLNISAGEQLDLICIPYTSLDNYVTSNQLEPLDDLLTQYAPTITALREEYPITDACMVQGVVYGVDPVQQVYGAQNGVGIRKEYMDETGIDPNKDYYTLEDLTEIFAAVKERHPDIYPFTFSNQGQSNFSWFYDADTLGVTGDSGVLLSVDSTEIVNMTETPEYLAYLKTMREWFEQGYVLPDAATTDMTAVDLLISGKCIAATMNGRPGEKEYAAQTYGGEWYILPVTKKFMTSPAKSGSCHWSVPITSESPEAAVRFLDLMYEDARISQLLYSGVEGVHYVDKGDHIEYPEGITYETCGYQNGWDLFGDNRQIKMYTATSTQEARDAFTEQGMQNKSKAYGYYFDTTNYAMDIMALNTIVMQYAPSLESGSVEDYESVLAEMNQKLESAGIKDIIAANQTQFDAWLAEHK